MEWKACKPRPGERTRDVRPVVHGDKLVWLWVADHQSEIYDPATDTWAPFATPFGDRGTREGAVIESIAGELVVWGGKSKPYSYGSSGKLLSGGQRLRADGTWQPMNTKKQPSARQYARRVWTGKELVVWGGSKKLDGAAYDPATDTWRKLSKQGASTSYNGDTIWSGTEMWMWGGADFSFRYAGVTKRNAGFAYDPASDTWRPLAAVPGTDEELLNPRSLVRLGDSALFVRKDEGSDVGTCSAWRYEPRADLWEPCTPPPEVKHNDPDFLECDGRIVLKLGRDLVEYLPGRDVWARLPSLPQWRGQLVWLAGAIYFLEDTHVYRLELPASPDVIAPVSAGASVVAPRRAPIERGSPVSAIVALDDGGIVVGHVDGSVRHGSTTLRAADDDRVRGLAVHGGTWACLVAETLEIRAWPPGDAKQRTTKLELPWVAYSMTHHEDTIVVAGEGGLLPITYAKGKWTAGTAKKAAGTTSEIALGTHGLARVVLGPKKQRGSRHDTHDTVEHRDHTLGKIVMSTLAKGIERGTTTAFVVENGVFVGGGGSYSLERYMPGKKRASEKLSTDTAWSSPAIVSADGRWLLARHAGRGAELYDLTDRRRELLYSPFDDDSSDELSYEKLSELHPPPLFVPADEVATFVEDTRYAGPVSAMAISPAGSTLALGMSNGVAFAIERDTLGVTMLTVRGEAKEIQSPDGIVVGRFAVFAIASDAARGVVCAIRASDFRYGELAVDTGEWTWGPALPAAQLRTLREYEWSTLSGLYRRGSLVVVRANHGERQRLVFDYATGQAVSTSGDPERRPVYELIEEPEPHLAAVDVVTGEQIAIVAVPFAPRRSTIVELGGGRWYVVNEGDADDHVVDIRNGRSSPVPFTRPVRSLDDTHFCVPEGPSGPFRRWQIYGADLATPVRKFESYLQLSELYVIGDRLVGLAGSTLAIFDAEGALIGTWSGAVGSLTLCAARDGSHLVGWCSHHTTIRRWELGAIR